MQSVASGSRLLHWAVRLDLRYPDSRKVPALGYGAHTLSLLEERASELGAGSIGLHVFEHNYAALTLYAKTGYNVTSIVMSKQLDADEG